MGNARNYQREQERVLERITRESGERPPGLFLHSCCAPCSSAVLERLRRYFRITVFYYNPNISAEEEYRKRVKEQKRLVGVFNREAAEAGPGNGALYPIAVKEGAYVPDNFYRAVKGLEDCPEGGVRCFACYRLRIFETARQAAAGGYDYFATTLTLSPLKDAGKLNEIGEAAGREYGVAWLPSDFKKKDGYRRSVELSGQYGLYRQDYCGCAFSKAERDRRRAGV